LFDSGFDFSKASPLLADQRRVLVAALEAALAADVAVGEALARRVRAHRDGLAVDATFVIEADFAPALHGQALAALQAGDVDLALAWARCVYVIRRRVADGWLPFLNFVLAARIFGVAWINEAPERLIARGVPAAIPRRVIQYWDKPAPPADVAAMIESWRHVPGYFHRLMDDAQARKFLDLHYGKRILAAYDAATHAAGKADVFRLAWLYRRGGIYADADERLVGRIDSLLPADCRVFLTWAQGTPPCVQNGFIAAEPLSPLIERALMLAVKRVEHSVRSGTRMNAWLQTGPGVMSMAVLDDVAIHGRKVATRGLYLMADPTHRLVVESDPFLEYRNSPTGNWRLEK
jgi:hypothetical protein